MSTPFTSLHLTAVALHLISHHHKEKKGKDKKIRYVEKRRERG
jgi:hypothetical protein